MLVPGTSHPSLGTLSELDEAIYFRRAQKCTAVLDSGVPGRPVPVGAASIAGLMTIRGAAGVVGAGVTGYRPRGEGSARQLRTLSSWQWRSRDFPKGELSWGPR